MEPITRIEKLYDAIARGGTIDFEPVTREEMFLYAILRNGGGGGGDGGDGGGISVSGAKAGQTVKIAAVDYLGIPIAWEAVDFPSDKHINDLINTALGVIENGTY